MTEMCREFGISRKTGYKIFDRYREHGLEALTDRSRRPVRYAKRRRSERLKLLKCPARAACARADFTRLRLLPSGAVRDTRRVRFWLPQVGQAGVSEEPISNSTSLSHSAQW